MSEDFLSDVGYRPDTPTFGVFFLLKCGPDAGQWVRLWSGEHPHTLEADDFDTEGGRYLPLGMPASLAALSSVFDGGYDTGEFALSGVDPTAIRLLAADRDLVENADIHLGLMDFDSETQPLGPCDWLATLIAGKPSWRRVGQGAGATVTIALPWASGFFDRNQSSTSYLSGESQRRISSGDAICDGVIRMQLGQVIPWPV